MSAITALPAFEALALFSVLLALKMGELRDHSEHTAANYFMHSGSGFQGRPSMGGWVTYGLGSECDNLPASSCWRAA